jgi:hypothetical protein
MWPIGKAPHPARGNERVISGHKQCRKIEKKKRKIETSEEVFVIEYEWF